MEDDKPVEVVFFDLRDTLGEVDRPGHLVPYRPSTEKLLSSMREAVGVRIGIITNLPKEISADQGRAMVTDSVLSIENGRTVTIGDFVDPEGIVINHVAGFDKPDPRIYSYAADQMGVPAERCIFCGENLIEVLGAKAAGMQTQLKPCPPGREFLPAPVEGLGASDRSSGRAFEAILEHEHLLGDRIFEGMGLIADRLKALGEGEKIPADLYTAMGILVYLTNNFADQAHLQAEEAVIPLAIARGMDATKVQWVFDHHAQGRAYFTALDVAWRRIEHGEDRDLPYAIDAFARSCEGFKLLFVHHAELENDELFPEIGKHFSDTDDTLAINIITHTGPPDFTPYVSLVAAMEEALGIESAE